MIDNLNIADLVQQEIKDAVDRYVQTVLADNQWQLNIENQITDFVKQRITAKFQNVAEIPDLVNTVQGTVRELFSGGHIPGLASYVDPAQIHRVIDAAIQQLVVDSLDNLIQDPDWVEKIQQHVEINLATRISEKISHIDVNSVIASTVNLNMESWRQKLTEDFQSNGIKDQADRCELVISNGAVVAQSGLACQSLLADQDVVTKNLVVTGTVNTDCESWNELAHTVAERTQQQLGKEWQEQLVNQILDLARTQGIDFQEVLLAGEPLVQGDRLNPAIKQSSIEGLGTLQNLSVSGSVDLSRTAYINNRRMGINTDSPDMALTVWDEETSLSLGKIGRDRAWIGSNRNHTLDIGTNRKKAITIEPDGLVSVQQIRVDRWRISFANSVPNHSGTRGDIVFNHDPKPGSPFAWQCLGAFKWQALECK